MARIAVLGTGMAGFGAWHRLREEPHDVVMYDMNGYFGGHTASWVFPPGFTFDHGPHVSFTKDERVKDILELCISRFNAFARLRDELDRTRTALEGRKVTDRAKALITTLGKGGDFAAAAKADGFSTGSIPMFSRSDPNAPISRP